MKRVFGVLYLLLMAVAVLDCLVRTGGGASMSLTDWVLVLVASSVSAVMLASVVFLAGDAYWFVCVPAFVWGVVTSGMEWFFRSYFAGSKLVGEELMVSIVTLSPEKVMAFFCEYCSVRHYLVFALVGVGMLVAVAWMTSRSVGAPTRRSVLGGLLLFGDMCFLAPIVMNCDHLMKAWLDHDFVRGGDELTMYRELKEGGAPLEPGAYDTSESNLLAVVVIGESSTRNRWSLYGYSRPTTPRLEAQADRLLVLSNVTASVAFTPFALRDLFTARGAGRLVSVPSAAVSAGYETALLSGQPRMGLYEGSDELLFAACEERQYLCDLLTDRFYYDGELLPLVRTALATPAPKRLLFVHTYGNHRYWRHRVPPTFVGFPADLRDPAVAGLSDQAACSVNEYDTSVLYMDTVLSELLCAVRAQRRPAVFAYVSDHGETPQSVARDHKHPDTHAVPCFFWFSDAYRARNAERIARLEGLRQKPLVVQDLYPVWMDLLGLRPKR